MYKAYMSESDSDNESTDTESSADTESTVETEYDRRVQQVDEWRRNALKWIAAPGRAPVTSRPPDGTGLGMYNTQLEFTERRRVSVLMINSLDRDPVAYPLPTAFRLQLPRIYRNIEKIEIVQLKFMSGLYSFSETIGNTTLSLTDVSGTVSVQIPAGNYALGELLQAIYMPLEAARPGIYTIQYNHNTGRVSISSGSGPFSLNFRSGAPAAKQVLTSNWGLGWNLGLGGPPVDLSGASS